MEKMFQTYNGMSVPQYDVIEVSIGFDEDWRAPGEWAIRWFSPFQCKLKTEYFDHEPADDEIARFILKSERADEVHVIADETV